MGKKTRRKKDWHHRVPDFKLVYCGINKRIKEEPKERQKRKLAVSMKNAA